VAGGELEERFHSIVISARILVRGDDGNAIQRDRHGRFEILGGRGDDAPHACVGHRSNRFSDARHLLFARAAQTRQPRGIIDAIARDDFSAALHRLAIVDTRFFENSSHPQFVAANHGE